MTNFWFNLCGFKIKGFKMSVFKKLSIVLCTLLHVYVHIKQ